MARKTRFSKAASRSRKWRRRKAKSRQQLLSIKTVEKVAKKVASRLDSKKDIALTSSVDFGTVPSTLAQMTQEFPEGDAVTMAGVFDRASQEHQEVINRCWGPQTELVAVSDEVYQQIDIQNSQRISGMVFLKSIELRGNFILPPRVHRATFHFTICRKRGIQYEAAEDLLSNELFIKNPYLQNYQRDLTQGTMSVLKDYTFSMRQSSGRNTGNDAAYSNLIRTVNVFHKINKKIEYVDFDELQDPESPDKADLKKNPYEFRLWSDYPDERDSNGDIKDAEYYPQFQGHVLYHYSCT